MDEVIFELDDKVVVVDNFNNLSRNFSYFGFILNDCISSLKYLCPNSIVESTKRVVNIVFFFF